MGEFSDALRRARKELTRSARREDTPAEPVSRPECEEGLDSEHLDPWLPPPREPEPNPEILPTPSGHEIPLLRDRRGRWKPRAVLVDRDGPLAESFRQIAIRLRTELERRSARSVAVVSTLRGEGKTTLACNLGLALASLSRGREIALLDLDLRAPSVAVSLDIRGQVGIDEFLKGRAGLGQICVSVEKPRLDVYPVRETCEAAHELLVQPSAERLFRELERRYAVVVIDTPPALLVPDAALILRHASAYATVARAGASRLRAVRDMVDRFGVDKLVGGILNAGRRPRHAGQYGYYAARGRVSKRG